MQQHAFEIQKTFAHAFAECVTTDPEVLRRLSSPDTFTLQEMKFVSESLNILSTSLGNFVYLIRILLQLELEEDAGNMLRRNTLTTKILDAFIARSCKRFLRRLLRDPLDSILNDVAVEAFEIEDTKILQQMVDNPPEEEPKGPLGALKRRFKRKKTPAANDGQPVRRIRVNRRHVQRLAPDSRERRILDERMESNSEKLANVMSTLNSRVFDLATLEEMPFELRAVALSIRELGAEHGIDVDLRIGALVLLRMINPAILFPANVGLCSRREVLSDDRRRALMLVTKLVQSIVNNKPSREAALTTLSARILSEWTAAREQYLSSVSLTREVFESREEEHVWHRRTFLTDHYGVFSDVSDMLRLFLASKGFLVKKINVPTRVFDDGTESCPIRVDWTFPKTEEEQNQEMLERINSTSTTENDDTPITPLSPSQSNPSLQSLMSIRLCGEIPPDRVGVGSIVYVAFGKLDIEEPIEPSPSPVAVRGGLLLEQLPLETFVIETLATSSFAYYKPPSIVTTTSYDESFFPLQDELAEFVQRIAGRLADAVSDLSVCDPLGSLGGGEASNLSSPMMVPFDPEDYVQIRDLGIVIHYYYVEEANSYVFAIRTQEYFAPFVVDVMKDVGEVLKETDADEIESVFQERVAQIVAEKEECLDIDFEEAKAYFKEIARRDRVDVVLFEEKLRMLSEEELEEKRERIAQGEGESGGGRRRK